MCGIFGCVIDATNADHSFVDQRMAAARADLAHRGPDDSGFEIELTEGGIVALGHTRLAIIDLSSSGRQPMHSADGRYSIVFNGEIYNFKELRAELRSLGHLFRTNSDTEVLLACWAQWGEACLHRLIGMFAFAVLDRTEQQLSLVRDAFGIKPLYYREVGGELAFASEISALLRDVEISEEIDQQRAYEYLIAGVQDEGGGTFIRGVHRVLAAHVLRVSLRRTASRCARVKQSRWWHPSIAESCRLSIRHAADRLRDLFLESVHLHLRSDVPVCVALSGGIDSSAIVCAARVVAPDADLHSFSFVPCEAWLSEEPWIDAVNRHACAVPHKVRIAADDLDRDYSDFIDCQGEPVGGPSVYAQWRVFQQIRAEGFKVALEGQGGDELLGGYVGYPGQYMRSCLERGRLSAMWRFARNYAIENPSSRSSPWRALIGQLLPNAVHRIGCELTGREAIPAWLAAGARSGRVVSVGVPRIPTTWRNRGRRVSETLRHQLGSASLSHLLRYGDRNAMHWSVENRTPFLTIPLAEFMLSLPESYLVSPDGQTKHLFRAAMRGIVPDEVLDRRDKVGFEAPTRAWIRRPALREISSEAADPPALRALVDYAAISKLISRQMDEPPEVSRQTWRLLNLVSWARRLDRSGTSVVRQEGRA